MQRKGVTIHRRGPIKKLGYRFASGQTADARLASVPSWKFVDEIKMPKSSSGKAQTAAIAISIARICNAAWRRFSASL
jgi:hypothetical protein